uniref:Cyclin N-terminal domain-containing protein n=1 Tax=Heterorhabditis bacteriophora TaxID=37862 RepID=A0A1I7XNX8_HETBA
MLQIGTDIVIPSAKRVPKLNSIDEMAPEQQTMPSPPFATISEDVGFLDEEDVWNLLCRKDEMIRPSHRLLDNHEDLNPRTRSVLLDWMMEVCDSEKQHRETYHLAVDYVDRFLTTFKNVRADTFQLVGTTALFLASKYEVRRFELIMLKHLEWSLSPVTSIHWLNVYMQLLGNKEISKNTGDKHVSQKPFTIPEYMREDFVHMAKVLDLVLLDVESLKYSYREMAAAVLFACYEPHALFQQVTGYSYEELLKVVEWVEPAVKVCDSHRATGDPMPILEGIRADDLHNIQTHPADDLDDLLKMVYEERTHLTCSRKRIPSIRKRGPLLPRCGNPD